MSAVAAPPGVVVQPAEFDARFGDGTLFARSAYRLETLNEYDSPETRIRVARFLAGEPDLPQIRAYWDQVISEARQAGKIMQRVHVVSEPLTDYLRFELACYEFSVEAGEDIRILPATATADLDLPSFDYWLFDEQRAAVMYYGRRGTWLRTEIVTDPEFIADCREWRDAALSRAIPLSNYLGERSAI